MFLLNLFLSIFRAFLVLYFQPLTDFKTTNLRSKNNKFAVEKQQICGSRTFIKVIYPQKKHTVYFLLFTTKTANIMICFN